MQCGYTAFMGIWLSLVAAFFFEEIVTTTGVLTVAHQQHLPALLIHALWFAVVFSETVVIYVIGVWLRKHYLKSRIGKWFDRKVDSFERLIGHHGKLASLGIFGFFFSPGLAAVFAAWLRIPFARAVS